MDVLLYANVVDVAIRCYGMRGSAHAIIPWLAACLVGRPVDHKISLDVATLEFAEVEAPCGPDAALDPEHAFSAVRLVRDEGAQYPYYYNDKTVAPGLKLSQFPQFGSISGAEFSCGSVTWKMVRACLHVSVTHHMHILHFRLDPAFFVRPFCAGCRNSNVLLSR
jgi:hypothetical protein